METCLQKRASANESKISACISSGLSDQERFPGASPDWSFPIAIGAAANRSPATGRPAPPKTITRMARVR